MSAGPNGWKHVRCARENETTPVRQKLPGPVLFFLNYKPEYVPNTLCKSGIYATFSDKKFSPFGRPVLAGWRGFLVLSIYFRKPSALARNFQVVSLLTQRIR